MFTDQATITIRAGAGGNGCVSFHREKYVARGGPDGGDGGRGGDIIFTADAGMSSLESFRHKRHYRADNGEQGKGNNMHGKSAESLTIRVPAGTLVRDVETGRILADLYEKGQEKRVLSGGRGGKGNARFATPTRQAPNFSTPGDAGIERRVELELKLIADIGLVGLPNAGKSTLLAALTAAKPKIADYPFTTLSPNLGVMYVRDLAFVIADIPGLIEGAHEGAGLGDEFLRHIERTRLLLHVVDVSTWSGNDPLADFECIENELKQRSGELYALPRIVAANKIEIAEEGAREAFIEAVKARGMEVYPISAAAHMGLTPLSNALARRLAELPPPTRYLEETLDDLEEDKGAFSVSRGSDAAFIVSGPAIVRLLNRVNPDDADSMRYFQQALIKSGIVEALREAGAKEGDSVQMLEWEFDFVE